MAGNHRAKLRVGLERASGDKRLEKFLWLEVRVVLSPNPARVLVSSVGDSSHMVGYRYPIWAGAVLAAMAEV